MGELARYIAGVPARLRETRPPDEAMNPVSRVGWIVVGVFFGVFGLWSLVAPLNGAVVAGGVVKIDGNRKSIQHVDGGTVREVRVREGSLVEAGDVLVLLDDTQARAEREILSQQALVLRLTEARLRAEAQMATQLEFPADLASRRGESEVEAVWKIQLDQFDTRRAALAGQRAMITEKIAQLEAQIAGSAVQLRGLEDQLRSVRKERESLLPALERGIVTRPRVLQLERTAASLEGQVGETNGAMARARQAIAEQRLAALQLGTDRLVEVTRDLRDTQDQLGTVLPRLANATATLERMTIRSPYNGRVVGLSIFSTGAVVTKGETIMDIVPERENLIVEAEIGVDEIADVQVGRAADLHLVAYKLRSTPVVRGTVINVSADRLTDTRTGRPHYTIQVQVDDDSLAAYPTVKLQPGMPATVMVPTIERSAFTYFVGPLTASMQQAFRQR